MDPVVTVGERALAACRTEAGWALFRAHVGAGALGKEVTYAGYPDAPRQLLEYDWKPAGECQANNLPQAVDYLTLEAVYVLTPKEVAVCLPLWFGLPLAAGPTAPGCGALAVVGGQSERRQVAGAFQRLKRALERAVGVGLVDTTTALRSLLLSVGPRTVGVGKPLSEVAGWNGRSGRIG